MVVRQKRTRRLADMLGQVRTDELTAPAGSARHGRTHDPRGRISRLCLAVRQAHPPRADPGGCVARSRLCDRGHRRFAAGAGADRGGGRTSLVPQRRQPLCGRAGRRAPVAGTARRAARLRGAGLYRRQRVPAAGGPRDAAAAGRVAGGRGARSAQSGPLRRGGRSAGRSAAGAIPGRRGAGSAGRFARSSARGRTSPSARPSGLRRATSRADRAGRRPGTRGRRGVGRQPAVGRRLRLAAALQPRRWPKRCGSEFHPHLPADRLQRILDLPATRSDPDGFRFGTRTRNALRAVWKRRRSAGRAPPGAGLHRRSLGRGRTGRP